MNTQELARKKELCQMLNMNFEEANKLFSNESLSNMTKAQINGGNPIVVGIIIGVAAGVVTHYVIKWLDGTYTTGEKSNVTFDDKGLNINGRTCTEYKVDTVGNHVTYSLTFPLNTPAPTPTPTPAGWHPPMN